MTVYVPQEVLRKAEGGKMLPAYNIYKAEKYGQLLILLPYGEVAMEPQSMVMELRRTLKDFNDDDYILPTGDPVAISAAVAIASSFNKGKVKILKWQGKIQQCYVVLAMNVGSDYYD